MSCLAVPGASETAELNSLLRSSMMIRRLKADVLAQLPPKRRTQVGSSPQFPFLCLDQGDPGYKLISHCLE
jgi:hypothetical protein